MCVYVCAADFLSMFTAFMENVTTTRIFTRIRLLLNICCDTERTDENLLFLLLLHAHSAH